MPYYHGNQTQIDSGCIRWMSHLIAWSQIFLKSFKKQTFFSHAQRLNTEWWFLFTIPHCFIERIIVKQPEATQTCTKNCKPIIKIRCKTQKYQKYTGELDVMTQTESLAQDVNWSQFWLFVFCESFLLEDEESTAVRLYLVYNTHISLRMLSRCTVYHVVVWGGSMLTFASSKRRLQLPGKQDTLFRHHDCLYHILSKGSVKWFPKLVELFDSGTWISVVNEQKSMN